MTKWSFFNDSRPHARQQYVCAHCGESISIGELHYHYWGKIEGEQNLVDVRLHEECRMPHAIVRDAECDIENDRVYLRGDTTTTSEQAAQEYLDSIPKGFFARVREKVGALCGR